MLTSTGWFTQYSFRQRGLPCFGSSTSTCRGFTDCIITTSGIMYQIVSCAACVLGHQDRSAARADLVDWESPCAASKQFLRYMYIGVYACISIYMYIYIYIYAAMTTNVNADAEMGYQFQHHCNHEHKHGLECKHARKIQTTYLP